MTTKELAIRERVLEGKVLGVPVGTRLGTAEQAARLKRLSEEWENLDEELEDLPVNPNWAGGWTVEWF